MSSDGARMIQTAVLRALAEHSQKAVSDGSGISESRISRWKSDALDGGGLHLDETCRVLAALGLAIVDASPMDLVILPRDEHSALRVLARKALS